MYLAKLPVRHLPAWNSNIRNFNLNDMALDKLELLLSLKDMFTGPLTAAKKKLKGATAEIKSNIESMRVAHVKAFAAMKDEIPGLTRALELAKSPYVAMAATAALLGVGIIQAKNAAAAFNHEFLELQNLNLDKSRAQIQHLNDKVLDTAFIIGKSAPATAKAYFDIQSATGKYGKEVDAIVEKVGKFSTATKTDFNEAINGAAKGMINFKFGADQLDAYLASSAKTVQVGITTFNELAKVQTEFAGSAAATGQTFDTANKIFATFSKVTKNVDIAATMTKTAFQGLADPKVVKALGEYGIKMFDAKGQFLATDKVIAQLVPKLGSMSDKKFSNFMGDVGGPEGLRELMNQIKVSGDDVLKTFDAFDKTEFNIDDALKNAMGDFTTLSSIVQNRYGVVMTELGQAILPTFARALDTANNGLKWVRENSSTIVPILKSIGYTLGVAGSAWLIYKGKMLLADLITKGMTLSIHGLKTAIMSIPIVGWALAAVGAVITLYQTWDEFRAVVDGTWNMFKSMMPLMAAFANLLVTMHTNPVMAMQAAKNIVSEWKKLDLGAAFDQGYNESMRASKARREEPESLIPEGDPTGSPTQTPGGGNGSDGVSKVVGDSHAARNITINIEALQKGNVEVHTQTSRGMSESQLQLWFQEMLLRMVRDTEAAV